MFLIVVAITMPSFLQQRKAYYKKYRINNKVDPPRRVQHNKRYYLLNADKIKAASRALYQAYPDAKKGASRALYQTYPDAKKGASRALYQAYPDAKKEASRALYQASPDAKKAASRAQYQASPDTLKAASRALYHASPDAKKAASRAQYQALSDKKKAISRAQYQALSDKNKAISRAQYQVSPDTKRAVSRAQYQASPDKKRQLQEPVIKCRLMLKRQLLEPSIKRHLIKRRQLPEHRIKHSLIKRKLHPMYIMPTITVPDLRLLENITVATKKKICALKKAGYKLAVPKPSVKEQYLQANLFVSFKARSQLINTFKIMHPHLAKNIPRLLGRTACRLAAKRLLNKVLQVRKMHAGALLKSIRHIKSIQIKRRDDFGKGCHSMSTEPYFFDSAYQLVKRATAIPINEDGHCIIAKEILSDEEGKEVKAAAKTAEEAKEAKAAARKKKKWECSSQCKLVTNTEVDCIVSMKAAFEMPLEIVRSMLGSCDEGCPNGHYTKLIESKPAHLKGHPIVCCIDGGCESHLRILRAASTHFPVLRTFLSDVHSAITSHSCVFEIDNALCTANYRNLMKISHMEKFQTLLSNEVEANYEQCSEAKCIDSFLRQPNLEGQLYVTYAKLITELEKEVNDYPEHVCCSCERLHQRKSVTIAKLSDDLGKVVWPTLKSYILKQSPNSQDHILYMCNYCKSMIKSNRLPPRCVLNGLQTVPIPPELAALDPLSRQLIQCAKCYQTIVRLGTYTGKVPVYNSLKACKGTMFFLPLPLNKTLETLSEVDCSTSSLPNPELYIIVNGKPTKSQIIWRSLVDVNRIKASINILRSCNWLYKDISKESVDEATKKIIEVSNATTSRMLEKASRDDIATFQACTIRNLDNKISSTSDIEQYKVLNIRKDPINNRQQHLDVMCFPVLFPNGRFGKFHPRQEKLSHCEYIKSKLLNKDSRFRKDAQYVFYLLWQKEM